MNFPEPRVPLDPTRLDHRMFLSRIQGNILKGHGRHHGHALYFRLKVPGPRTKVFWQEIAKLVTSATQQDEQVAEHRSLKSLRPRATGPSVHRNVGFTAAGMQALGVGDTATLAISGRTPDEDLAPAFNAGMRGSFRGASAEVAAEIANWDPGYGGEDLHGFWFFAGSQRQTLKRAVQEMRDWCARWELTVVTEEPTTTWRHRGRPREAFGFVDGISMPEFFKDRPPGGPWVDMPLSQVLITPEFNPRHAGGSFLVMRKLEQNVRAFRAHERALQEQLKAARLGHWMAGPLLMGRQRDGKPLAALASGTALNAFDFNRDASAGRCPFHAHIRKMNPRMDSPPPHDPFAPAGDDLKAAQLVRRGMLYDPEGRLHPKRRRLEGWPDSKVGLLFMACMSDIRRQFERMHLHWAPNPHFPAAHTGVQDPILAQVAQPWRWQQLAQDIRQFVTPLGGEYFYLPSLDWLSSHA